MATIQIKKTYSATYTVTRAVKGFQGSGRIWKGNKPTDITFKVSGTSLQNAINKTIKEAYRVCPPEE